MNRALVQIVTRNMNLAIGPSAPFRALRKQVKRVR
jgi:hypothetical protein